MFSTRWQSFAPALSQFAQLQNEVNRLFDRLGGDGRHGHAIAFPAINVWEEDNALLVEAELPGLSMKDVEIYVTGNDQLTIKGERKQSTPAKGVQHRQEREFGSFVRLITLPIPVDANKVDARLENGVLLLRLPMHEMARPQKITVKGQ